MIVYPDFSSYGDFEVFFKFVFFIGRFASLCVDFLNSNIYDIGSYISEQFPTLSFTQPFFSILDDFFGGSPMFEILFGPGLILILACFVIRIYLNIIFSF